MVGRLAVAATAAFGPVEPCARTARRVKACGVAILASFSACAAAADVLVYEAGYDASFTAAGSAPASCAAAYAQHYEASTRLYSRPEWQGVCWALHFVGASENLCTMASFASWGIPPEMCPPAGIGWPDNPYWHIYLGVSKRAVAAADRGLGRPTTHCTEGNPCDPATGNKIQVETDYAGSGPFPLRFVRTYNWLSKGLAANLGPNWRHNYDRRLLVNGATDAVAVFRDDGAVTKFQPAGANWVSDADVTDRLEALPGGQWKLTTPDGDITEIYDAAGKLLEIADRAGVRQTLSYFSTGPNTGMLKQVADHFGRTLRFAYNPRNYLSSMTDPDGRVTQYEYDSGVRLTTVTYPATNGPAPTRTYLYEDPDLQYALTGIEDENGGRFATFAYSGGRAVESKHAGDAGRIQLSYPSASQTAVTTHVASGVSATRTYTFDTIFGVKRRTSISGPACPTCGPKAETFDSASGFRTSSTDWNGNTTCFKYDAQGHELVRGEGLTGACATDLSTWTPAGGTVERKTTTEWHPVFRLASRVCEPKRITTLGYDDKGNLTSRSEQPTADEQGAQGCGAAPAGSARTWTYRYTYGAADPAVVIQVVVDGPRTDVADVTTYAYEESTGNLLSITNALGQQTTFGSYDAHGKPLSIVDPNGVATTLVYDARQRLTSRSVGGELTAYEYDGVGQVTRVTLPDGSFLVYSYDAAHRRTGIADALGNRITYTLDLAGNRIREDIYDPANALAQTRSRVYSNLNRLEQEIGGANPAAQISRYAYDNQGNLTAITDPLNRVTLSAYDALNRLRQVTDPAAGVTGYGYDGRDQLISVTDPRRNTTGYARDGLGNLTQQLSPDTGPTTNIQDAAGNTVTSTDAKGQSTSYAYDALNRVTRIVYSQAKGTQLKQVDYGYDQGTSGIGRLTSITETAAAGSVLQTTTYGYDQRGRVVSEARAIGGTTHTTRYVYDAAGRITGVSYPSGRTLAYGLDPLGRVNRVETTGGGTAQVVVQDVAYYPTGIVRGFTFGNLEGYARNIDLDGRIASHSLGAQTKNLTFDAASRVTRVEQQGVPASFAAYGYDALDRLTSAVLPTSTYSFGYDAVGNRVSKFSDAGTDTYGYPPTSNRLASIAGASTRTYTHDANGAILADGVNAFDYDARGRLASSSSGAGGTTYQVNALGQRVRKSSIARGHGVSLRPSGTAPRRVLRDRRPHPGVPVPR